MTAAAPIVLLPVGLFCVAVTNVSLVRVGTSNDDCG